MEEQIMVTKRLRQFVGAVAFTALCFPADQAVAAGKYIGGWQKDFPVVKYGVIPVETQSTTVSNMDAFIKHAEKETGVKWELYTASDYSGVMNALIAKQIHLSWLSGFSYCQTRMDSKGGVEPLVAAMEPDGSMGYVSVIVVKAESPYKTIEDLKGKVVARTDPLSTSGNPAFNNLTSILDALGLGLAVKRKKTKSKKYALTA